MTGAERKRRWRQQQPQASTRLDARLRQRKRQRQRLFIAWLRKGRCHDCGDDCLELQFDHVEGPKRFNLGSFRKPFARPTWQQIIDEVLKCERVCDDCHKERTRRRGPAWRPPVYEKAPF